jgi:alpha 1,2-mannosyltransferase
MRLDQDSLIHSPVKYNVIEGLQQHGALFGYTAHLTEQPTSARAFPETVNVYLTMFGPSPKQLLKHCSPSSLDGLVNGGWDRWAYSNALFLTDLSFWMRPAVVHFLNLIDRSGGMYTQRWSDALTQTAAVQIFMEESEVHRFDNFTFEHAVVTKHP